MILYIIRHGDPDYTTDSLTEKGRLQAELVGKRLFDVGIDRVFSSPLGRARQTAEPLCRMAGLECNIEEWTREVGTNMMMTTVPDGTPKSLSGLQNTYFLENGGAELAIADSFECPPVKEGRMKEACAVIERGGDEFLERLGYKKENGVYRILRENNERVALFCHGTMGRAWIASLLHIPFHIMWASFKYTHTGVTAIEFKNNENGLTAPKCFFYSDMSHLYAAGAENMTYNNTTKI
jgi:probable phosphoglycerate mutase